VTRCDRAASSWAMPRRERPVVDLHGRQSDFTGIVWLQDLPLEQIQFFLVRPFDDPRDRCWIRNAMSQAHASKRILCPMKVATNVARLAGVSVTLQVR
jgi:hypothetical protein